MFETLFNYPPSVWRNAELVFASGWSQQALLLAFAAVLIAIALTLLKLGISGTRRVIVGVLQAVVLSTALLMLWQPALRVDVTQAGENTVAYVLDTSASMQFADVGGDRTRLESAVSQLNDHALTEDDQFDASLYTLGGELAPIEMFDDLPAPANRTNLVDGLANLLNAVNERSLAAVVLLSDGSNNVDSMSSDWWQNIKSAGVPVHTIGVGSVVIEDDIELADVDVDAVATPDTPVSARLRITHGQGGTARLRISNGDDLLLAEDIELDEDSHETIHVVTFNSGEAGVRELEFSVTADKPESNTINNQQPRVLEVQDRRKRILYVEGEPRWEYKFLRRAVHDNAGVEVVSLLRTSPNKFYRQGVRDATELANGFPQTRDQLFAYDAVIVGSFEAALLSADQQANLRDFVNVRGGSLLMLAGRSGLADGGWGRSAVTAALPVVLSSRTSNNTYSRERVSVGLTEQGRRASWLRLGDDDASSQAVWSALPEVADVQSVGEPKPGSVVVLASVDQQEPQPLLVWQRYGQGQSYVLGTSGTWRWQMGLPFEDQSHERFWQQLLAHLVADSLPQLTVETRLPVYRDTADVAVSVIARNDDYTPLERSELVVSITKPDGRQEAMTLTPDIARPGRYVGSINMPQTGPYAVTASKPLSGEAPASNATSEESTDVQRWWVHETGTAEFFDAGQNQALLKRLAQETGGRYLSLDNIEELPGILATENAALTREERLPLWNMPFFFLLLLFGKLAEWMLRLRWKRL